MNATVIEITRNRMEDSELKSRFEEIRDRKRDPDWARLFAEARTRGRTQEDIARVVGLSQHRISYLLTFADWITWVESITMVINADFTLHSVTERLFRKFWNKHSELKGRENDRRRAVLDDLIYHQREQKTHDPKRFDALVKAIREHGLVNGKKYRVEQITEKIGQPEELLQDFISEHAHGAKDGIRAERLGKHTFRLHPAGKRKPIDPDVLLSMVQCHLDELKAMSQLHRARIVTASLYQIAMVIERAIKGE